MSMESELMTYLAADTTLAALVSTRIYMGRAPEEAVYPHIVYRRIKTSRDYATFGSPSLFMPLYAIHSISQDHEVTLSVANAIFSALDDYIGSMGTTVVVHSSLMGDQYDLYDDGKEAFVIVQTCSIWYRDK